MWNALESACSINAYIMSHMQALSFSRLLTNVTVSLIALYRKYHSPEDYGSHCPELIDDQEELIMQSRLSQKPLPLKDVEQLGKQWLTPLMVLYTKGSGLCSGCGDKHETTGYLTRKINHDALRSRRMREIS